MHKPHLRAWVYSYWTFTIKHLWKNIITQIESQLEDELFMSSHRWFIRNRSNIQGTLWPFLLLYVTDVKLLQLIQTTIYREKQNRAEQKSDFVFRFMWTESKCVFQLLKFLLDICCISELWGLKKCCKKKINNVPNFYPSPM